MNRKGFTLIELLAVIVVLGLVLLISVPIISDAYTKSKIKSEEVFVDRLTQAIDSYVKLNSDTMSFSCNSDKCEGTKTVNEKDTYNITYQMGTITINDIINDGILTQKDFVNAGNNNKNVSCEPNAEVEVYKDSDFVYCYKVHKDSLGCLTKEYKSTIKGDYAIDTCEWK
ncbi:MAG: prepilin-type N-terminal cleavage/methylation domain-containing protein [Bacilli bacterium]|nr:prepilin-type N-terminal cleavage/methylation domain-containing protein [Bacilli bacterium]